ncbi:MAG: macro domain-containing protein [Myxococcota bacterium]|nr:macro domain-containing protein [Myxococcota bacterium]
MPVAVQIGPLDASDTLLDCGPEFSLEEVCEEVEDAWDGTSPIVLGACAPLSDATILELAERLHRTTASVILLVRSRTALERVEQALPGSGLSQRYELISGRTLVVVEGDIIRIPTDGLVNPSNRFLRLGAGVSGAISRQTRPSLQVELTGLAGVGGVEPGGGVVTGAHGLPYATAIVHVNAVSGKAAVVAQATRRALELASETNLTSLSLPLLGTGTGGLSIRQGSEVMLGVVKAWSQETSGNPQTLRLVVWGDAAYQCVLDVLG